MSKVKPPRRFQPQPRQAKKRPAFVRVAGTVRVHWQAMVPADATDDDISELVEEGLAHEAGHYMRGRESPPWRLEAEADPVDFNFDCDEDERPL